VHKTGPNCCLSSGLAAASRYEEPIDNMTLRRMLICDKTLQSKTEERSR
jgi:hypothetical protein